MSSITATSSTNDSAALAQLDAASQLLAAANLLQQQNNGDNSSKSNNNNTSVNVLKGIGNSFLCNLCGVTLPNIAEFQAHFHSHQQQLDTMLAPGQFNYGMHLLNFLQNSRSSANNSPAPSLGGGIPSPTTKSNSQTLASSTPTGSANVRKRKLLASQATLEALQEQDSSSGVGQTNKPSISPKNGADLAQNLLAQFANEASKAQHLSVSVVNNLNGKIGTELSNGSGSPLQAYPCTSCHKTFATEVDLKAHTLRHLTQHPFVCYSCGKGFKYNHSLHFHIKQYHNGGGSESLSENINGTLPISGTTNITSKDKNQNLRRSKKIEIESSDNSDDGPLNLHRSTPISGLTSTGLNHNSFQSSELYQRLTLMDENHNAAGSAEKAGSDFSVSVGLFGKPPTNLPADSSIQIRSEKVLATVLEAINVHTDQSVVLYKCCLCAVAFATLDQLSIHVSNVHHSEITPVDALDTLPSTPKIVCEKCSAKFAQQAEYEIHMQLHRSLEASQNVTVATAAGNTGQGTEVLYPFSLLSHLTSGSAAAAAAAAGALANGQTISPGSTQASTIDFRHIMASASKDTDFGRKFAAQLLAGDSDSGRHSPASASSSNKAKSQDSNNNSLMFLVPEPSKPPSSRSQYVQQFKDMNTRLASVVQTTNKNTASSNNNFNTKNNHNNNVTNNNGQNLNHNHLTTSPSKTISTPTVVTTIVQEAHQATPSNKKSRNNAQDSSKVPTRNLKEPVDIFEGAGQSLPIQKFSVGDIQETSPGVFKCRFCEKCFDRVFSVHRHERVHTGFKPCICKTCGRGFSEKRNLRHHIIRFHSDGSGRDLLKRKRNNVGKSHSANISNSEFLSHYDRLMTEATGNGSVSSSDAVLGLSENKGQLSQSALHMSLAMLDRIKQEMQTGSDSEESQPKITVNRRKSATKPPRKLDVDNRPVSNGDPETDMTSDDEEYSLRIDASVPECKIKVEIDSEM